LEPLKGSIHSLKNGSSGFYIESWGFLYLANRTFSKKLFYIEPFLLRVCEHWTSDWFQLLPHLLYLYCRGRDNSDSREHLTGQQIWWEAEVQSDVIKIIDPNKQKWETKF